MAKYEEIEIEIKNIKEGDKVLGIDGDWYEVNVLPIHTPNDMFKIEFENGSVECSGDHLWSFCLNKNRYITRETREIYEFLDIYKNYNCGEENGPRIVKMSKIEAKPCRCIETDAPHNLFQIITDRNESIFTHNCQMRIVCGRLGSVASMMALGNTQATTINGKQPGAGAISSNGVIDMIQHYYASHKFITDWFAKRGMNKFGMSKEDLEKEERVEVYEDFSGDENLDFIDEKVEFEFGGIKKEIDKTKDQIFEEI